MRSLAFALALLSLTSTALAALNAPCGNSAECIEVVNSVCLPNLATIDDDLTCQCDSRYVPDGVAACKGALNEICDAVSEVKASCNDIPYALCSSKDGGGPLKCQCIGGYTASSDNLHCLAPDFRNRCIDNEQCTGFHEKATCSADTESCVCPDGFVQTKDQKCVEEKEVGRSCSAQEQCPTNSECNGLPLKSCNCVEDFVQVERTCVPVANVVGDECVDSKQCEKLNLDGALAKAICVSQRCMCPDGYVTSNDKIFCLPKVTINNKNCMQDQQCDEGFYCEYPDCVPIPVAP